MEAYLQFFLRKDSMWFSNSTNLSYNFFFEKPNLSYNLLRRACIIEHLKERQKKRGQGRCMIWTANINIQLSNNEMLMMPIIVIMCTMSLCWEFKVQCDGTGKRSGLLGRVPKPSVANRNACRLRSVEASAYEKRSNTTTEMFRRTIETFKIPSSTIGAPVERTSTARCIVDTPSWFCTTKWRHS